MDLQYEVTRKRKEFGVHPVFKDSPVVHFDQENLDTINDFVEIPQKTREFHCIPEYSAHAVNTEAFIQEDVGINHVEGGWPDNINQPQDKQRFLRKIEADSGFSRVCSSLVQTLKQVVDSNLTIDLYKPYFDGPQDDFSTDPPSVDTVFLVRDPTGANRKVCKIAWHPENAQKFAVAYASTNFESNIAGDVPLPSYIWDINNSISYDAELLPESPLMCCAFNPKRPDELVGGCYNGVVAFWDTRAGKRPREQSPIQNCHHDPVFDVAYIQCRSGNEFCSVSTDGQMLWWDARRLSEPIDSFKLIDPEDNVLHGATCLEYRLDAGGTKYLVGTESGLVFNVERKAKKAEESQKTIKAIFGKKSKHLGPVRSVKRNYATVKGFLTSGDWGCRMWTEEVRTSNFGTGYDEIRANNASWSPSRFGVFFVGKANGYLDIWDYMLTQDKPTWSQKILEHGISTIATDKTGRTLAVGDEKGTTAILRLSNSLTIAGVTEKADVQQMFEREGAREKTLNQSIKTKLAAAGQIAKKKRAENAAAEELREKNEQIASRFVENLSDIDQKYLRTLEKNRSQMMELKRSKDLKEDIVEVQESIRTEPEQKQDNQIIEKEAPKEIVEEPEPVKEEINVEAPEETTEVPEVIKEEEVEAADPPQGAEAKEKVDEPIQVSEPEAAIKEAEPEVAEPVKEDPEPVEAKEEIVEAKEAEPVKESEPEPAKEEKPKPDVAKEEEIVSADEPEPAKNEEASATNLEVDSILEPARNSILKADENLEAVLEKPAQLEEDVEPKKEVEKQSEITNEPETDANMEDEIDEAAKPVSAEKTEPKDVEPPVEPKNTADAEPLVESEV